jgi:hypothetical protein|tara:strand:+ start:3105 stop:3401 length:297 start_codon:yes stop_codon:yes gene_type:complete
MDVTKFKKFGESHSKKSILEKIVDTNYRIVDLESKFNENPSQKTATPLSNQRVFLNLLVNALPFTAEEVRTKAQLDSIKHQKFTDTVSIALSIFNGAS